MSSFRKRNVVLSTKGNAPASQSQQRVEAQPGIKPSPVTGHATTSTGTESLDKLLGLGAGLALGSSLLIEEEGTTEFARSLLSCYAAEGVLQGHSVIVIGPEGSLNLPGLAEESKGKSSRTVADADKMKIAWRYERLGAFGERERGSVAPDVPNDSTAQAETSTPFCHNFDLTKKLAIPASRRPPRYVAPSIVATSSSPLATVLSALITQLTEIVSQPTRLVIPSLLSPLIYPPSASQPHHLLSFLHRLRSIMRQHSNLTIMISWPLALYPSSHPLLRWSRHLCDGVISLRPFPHSFSIDAIDIDSGAKGKAEEKMQGLIKVLKLPILTEKGVSVGVGEDMAFAVGRRRFLIRPFHLPPLEDDDGGGGGEHDHGGEKKPEAKSLEF